MIYLDHAATTPIDNRVFEAMLPWLTKEYGNPSTLYPAGIKAKKAIEDARTIIAKTLGCDPEEIYFTSGGTESNNMAINIGINWAEEQNEWLHILTTPIEHPAIIKPCEHLEKIKKATVRHIPISYTGLIQTEIIPLFLEPGCNFITVMLANNEIGTIQPIRNIQFQFPNKDYVKGMIHTDAVQAYGHMKINVGNLGIGMLSASAHKFYGPKGVGFLYINKGLKNTPFIRGGGQERGLRSGTENVALIVGMGKAAEIAYEELEKNTEHEKELRSLFYGKLLYELGQDNVLLNGPDIKGQERTANNLNIRFPGIRAEVLLGTLSGLDVCASAGSACHGYGPQPSHVLKAIGLSDEEAAESIRFSFGKDNTREEIMQAADTLIQCVGLLK